jgi:FkbM family methyltransferase
MKTIKIDELGMTMTMSMEGEKHYSTLRLANRNEKHAIASTRFDSDIPMPYYNWPWTLYMDKQPEANPWSLNWIQTTHVPLSKVKRSAVFIARNCGSLSGREKIVSELMGLMSVESVSSCLNNVEMPQSERRDKLKMMRKYALYLAFENERTDDYITEKLWNTFRAGVIPVYFGAPNVKQHVPDGSIISVDDFKSTAELANHLNRVLEDESLYESYHAWRYKPLPRWFVRKYNFTHVHSACRTCRWASAKLRGLPWNKEQQQIGGSPPCVNGKLEPYTSGCSTSAKHCLHDTKIPCCQDLGFKTLNSAVRVLNNHMIKYSLWHGTLLAAARDKYMQPWDTRDIDIIVPASDIGTVIQVLKTDLGWSPFRTGGVVSFRDKVDPPSSVEGMYCVHDGEQAWDKSYSHDYSIFRNPPYLDIYPSSASFKNMEKFKLGTLNQPRTEFSVLKSWKDHLDKKYKKWKTRPESISKEQYAYHGVGGQRNSRGLPWNKEQQQIPPHDNILWVIPAFKRAWSLDLVLQSLSTQTHVLVSKDADSDKIDSVLKKYSVEVIEHPWSCSRHPNRFPAKDETLNENYKGDTYGNPRSPWATCLKHHWWWMMKQAWSRKPERVCVLEDDTVIYPQAFEWLDKNKEGNVKLTPEEIAVPWCMSAKEWSTIDPKAFCEHDDYNWDQTIAWMFEHGHGPNQVTVPSTSLSMHVGDCGGWDAGGRDKKCTSKQIGGIRRKVAHWLAKPLTIGTTKRKWLTAHSKPNGGWGHPKDWAHCLGEKDTCLQWSNVGGCRYHAAADAWMCTFDWMSINMNGVHVSKGGSKIEHVLHRHENVEFIKLNNGAIGIPYIPHGPKKWHHKKLISAATTKTHKCEQTITGTTLFFERIEYANLWHTMNDWFNVHWTLETLGNPSEVTIVWLDGHAWGHLDAAWGEIFSARTKYISEYSGHVCFEKAVWVPKNTPVWNTDMPSGRCGIMDRFVQRVFSAYGIIPSLSEDVVIDRKDYMAHPRYKSGIKNDRIIEHLDQMFPSSKVIQLETMTFKEQVQLIANAKRLRGVHGAGLTHLIWLPDGAEVVEWVAPSHASVKLFEHIATWRPKIRYSSAKMPLVVKHHLTIPIPFREKISGQATPSKNDKLIVHASPTYHEVDTDLNLCKSLKPAQAVKTKLAIVRTNLNTVQPGVEYIAYIAPGLSPPPSSVLQKLSATLAANPKVDAVGAYVKRGNTVTQECRNIELCHWTILLHFEYSCSKGSLMRCDATSNIFVTRTQHSSLFDFRMGSLTALDFFLKLKQQGGFLATDVRIIINVGMSKEKEDTTEEKHNFVMTHAVDEIINRDTEQIQSLCTKCDAKIVSTILNGKTWSTLGMTMPMFAYAAYVRAFQSAVRFLNANDVQYVLIGGSLLGLFKLGHLLPWDNGDVDFYVDVSNFGCQKWLQMMKKWADDENFIHPHTSAKKNTASGATCRHYGAYAMPKGSDVDDPFSIGLVTFTQEPVPISSSDIYAYGVHVHVPDDIWKSNEVYYHDSLLAHKKWQPHANNGYNRHGDNGYDCAAPDFLKHNCIIDKDGTHLDTCMEYTRFGRATPSKNDKLIVHASPTYHEVDSSQPREITCDDVFTNFKSKTVTNKCTDKHFEMAVHQIPDIVSDVIKKTGCWERDIISRIVKHLGKEKKLFLDVGANIGSIATTIASLGHEVIAVEPFKLNVPILQKTMCMNNQNVHLFKVGVADTTPGQKMCIWSTNKRVNNGNARMTPYFEGKRDFGLDKQKECMEVIYTYTLDDLLFNTFNLNKRIYGMKIDIEGFETRAFRGAKKLLSSPYKPCKIWFEYKLDATVESGVPKYELFETLESAGYTIKSVVNGYQQITSPNWGDVKTADLEATLEYCDNDIVTKQDVLRTEDIVIDYHAPENSGPWKQGWNYDYDGRYDNGDKLHIHVVPHSHNDPGWLKTYHQYYSTQTKLILNTLVDSLMEDTRRTVIWAEMSFLSLWWDEASPQRQEALKKLIEEKQFDIVTGGWVMNDEASPTEFAIRTQLEEGRQWINHTFGADALPEYSWQIDPFGHSAGQAAILKDMGYKGLLIQRVHYAIKKKFAQEKNLEFMWDTPNGKIFTHMMPFYSYDGPHTCGPDPKVCCQFDFARLSGYGGCPWGIRPQRITPDNVAERSRLWLDQVRKKAMLYRTRHVLVPVGDDFRYQTKNEADLQYNNYQQMFDWLNEHEHVQAEFSTLTRYMTMVSGTTQLSTVVGSFFPYSDRVEDYWTGYFNSRIFYKGYDRLLERLIQGACKEASLTLPRRALALFQHHDGITGTAVPDVVQDYYNTMKLAVDDIRHQCHIDELKPLECVPTEEKLKYVDMDGDGYIRAFNGHHILESLRWYDNIDGGVYLMHVKPRFKKLTAQGPMKVCKRTDGKLVVTTDFGLVTRRVVDGYVLEIAYETKLPKTQAGELWAMYHPDFQGWMCSDVNGMQMECHHERHGQPLQAKFYPMSSKAWVTDGKTKFVMTSEQATGVGLVDGLFAFMLDRYNAYDDHRGMQYGAMDVRETSVNFKMSHDEGDDTTFKYIEKY